MLHAPLTSTTPAHIPPSPTTPATSPRPRHIAGARHEPTPDGSHNTFAEGEEPPWRPPTTTTTPVNQPTPSPRPPLGAKTHTRRWRRQQRRSGPAKAYATDATQTDATTSTPTTDDGSACKHTRTGHPTHDNNAGRTTIAATRAAASDLWAPQRINDDGGGNNAGDATAAADDGDATRTHTTTTTPTAADDKINEHDSANNPTVTTTDHNHRSQPRSREPHSAMTHSLEDRHQLCWGNGQRLLGDLHLRPEHNHTSSPRTGEVPRPHDRGSAPADVTPLTPLTRDATETNERRQRTTWRGHIFGDKVHRSRA